MPEITKELLEAKLAEYLAAVTRYKGVAENAEAQINANLGAIEAVKALLRGLGPESPKERKE